MTWFCCGNLRVLREKTSRLRPCVAGSGAGRFRKEVLMAELKVTDECIGCESCVELCRDVFVMDETIGRATVKDPSSTAECVDQAMEVCPVSAIVRE